MIHDIKNKEWGPAGVRTGLVAYAQIILSHFPNILRRLYYCFLHCKETKPDFPSFAHIVYFLGPCTVTYISLLFHHYSIRELQSAGLGFSSVVQSRHWLEPTLLKLQQICFIPCLQSIPLRVSSLNPICNESFDSLPFKLMLLVLWLLFKKSLSKEIWKGHSVINNYTETVITVVVLQQIPPPLFI